MKVYVDKDELYPYYSLSLEARYSATKVYDLDEKVVKQYQKTVKAFDKAWKLLDDAIKVEDDTFDHGGSI